MLAAGVFLLSKGDGAWAAVGTAGTCRPPCPGLAPPPIRGGLLFQRHCAGRGESRDCRCCCCAPLARAAPCTGTVTGVCVGAAAWLVTGALVSSGFAAACCPACFEASILALTALRSRDSVAFASSWRVVRKPTIESNARKSKGAIGVQLRAQCHQQHGRISQWSLPSESIGGP